MTAPNPSPAEQAVIDRFGIFEPEARVVEEVARAICEADEFVDGDRWTWEQAGEVAHAEYRRLAAAAVAAYRAAQDGGAEHGPGKCVPMEDANRALYVAGDAEMQLEALSAQDGGAEEAVRRVEALAEEWSEYPSSPEGARARELRAALAPQAGE